MIILNSVFVKNSIGIFVVYLVILFSVGCKKQPQKLAYTKKNNVIEINNGLIKARFKIENKKVTQEYFAYKNEDWILVAESFIPISHNLKN